MGEKNRFLALSISLILISGAISPAFVSPAFATTETLYMVSKGGSTSAASQLWTLDKTTGIATKVGTGVGFDGCTSMDFVGQTLFAACELDSDTDNRLITIDRFTGVGADVGANGDDQNYGGMSAHPTTDVLYAYESDGFGTGLGLGTMNQGSGFFTAIDDGGLKGGNGMAFSSGGTLYIARADTATATPDVINTVDISNGDETFSATIVHTAPLEDDDKPVAMDFSVDGKLWAAIKEAGGAKGSGDTYLVTLNPTTGVMNTPALIREANDDPIVGVDGIAFLEEEELVDCSVHVEWDNPTSITSPTEPTGNPTVLKSDCPEGTFNEKVPATLECGVTPETVNGPIPLCRIIVPNFIDELDHKIILIDITFTGSPIPSMQPTVTCFDPTLPFGQGEGTLFDGVLDGEGLFIWDFDCRPNPDWEEILIFLDPNVQKIQIWTESFDDSAVGGTFIPIDQSALLLAGVQSVSMWMIPVVLAGIGVGVFVIKRRN